MSVKVHESFCLDSFQDRLLWFDDFHGDQLQDEWRSVGTGSAVVVDAQTGGIVRITTGAVDTNTHQIDWAAIRSLLVTKKVTMEFRAKLSSTSSLVFFFDLHFDGSNLTGFYINGANFGIRCVDGGAPSGFSSGIALDVAYHIFRIEAHTHGANHVHFYIDGVETANSPITTNVPDDGTDYLQPRFYLQTTENVAKSMDIDYVYIRQER